MRHVHQAREGVGEVGLTRRRRPRRVQLITLAVLYPFYHFTTWRCILRSPRVLCP